MKLQGKKLDYVVTSCCCMGFLLLGYDQGLMSGIVGYNGNRFAHDFGFPDAHMQGNITAMYDIGCVIGSIICFFVGDKIGRKKAIMAGGSIMIVGTVILASSYTIAQLIVGRIVTGIGNGFNSSTIPVFQSEMAKPHNRGALLSMQAVVTIAGLCIAYWLDYGTSYTFSSFQWRFPMAFQSFFAVFLVAIIVCLPETPRWLVFKDRHEEALEVLARLYDTTITDSEVQDHLAYIDASVKQESAGGPFRISELFTTGKIGNLRRLCLTIMVMLMQQFTGSNMINYYAPVVYQNTMNLDRNTSLILGGCTSLTYFVASFIPIWTIDRFGRRLLLMVSSVGLCVCFVLAAALLSHQTLGRAYGACAMVFLFQVFLGIGWLPVPWFYPSEINTTRLRSRGMAIGSAFNWLAVFAVVEITPIAIDNIGWRTFIIFAILNGLWGPIVFCFFPETSGLELEDIDHIFDRGGLTGGVLETRGRTVTPGSHQEIVEATFKGAEMHNEDV
ncbi:high-affinity glucose transporter Hxt2p [Trichomonascus vanleenenianus]|uniref:sugar porter family MFS transporter n=1 Tax=Trichomonascus vanleenenianus TaxID=2268995 RepID=UPI003EC9A821